MGKVNRAFTDKAKTTVTIATVTVVNSCNVAI